MIFILGDIHGNFEFIRWTIKSRHLNGCTFIQVGDFGIGYQPGRDMQTLENLNKFLSDYNCFVYAIRGNHDDPKYFNGDFYLSNLKLMKDYSTEIIDEQKFLFVGGAVSIDRKYSLEHMQLSASFGMDKPRYWFDEKFVYDEEQIKNLNDVNIVITHTAPEWCIPDNRKGFGDFVQAFIDVDENLKDDLIAERNELSKLFDKLVENKNPLGLHFYGHFHNSARTEWNGILHQLVDINEVKDLAKFLPDKYTF